MDLASGVCFLVSEGILWVNVSHQNFVETDIYTHQNFSDCFGLAISKRGVEEDDWVQLSMVLKLTYKNSCVLASPIFKFDTDRQQITLNKIIILLPFNW